MGTQVMTGLEHFQESYWKRFKGLKIGLLCNQASVDRYLRSSKDIISSLLPGSIKALFTPQHGYGAEEQDNMNETPHGFEAKLHIPIFSLYSETREPLKQMLEPIDVLVVDLQDVGCRVYTFATTMLNCMKAAGRYGKKIVVLDRPNPLGGEVVEGNLLKKELFSFVGPYTIPMRHGLTMGEMALMFHEVHRLECELEVIKMLGWRRDMLWEDTGLPWVMPSPNMPLPQTAYVYPGQVIWEGTNISEGRGTCRPFEIFGAPFVDTDAIERDLDHTMLPGCRIMVFQFKPAFNKWHDRLCKGFFIHITNPRLYSPYRTTLLFLNAVLTTSRDDFRWTGPPYEYVQHLRPIDVIIGDQDIVRAVEQGMDIPEIEKTWQKNLAEYLEYRRQFLIYE